MRSLKEAFIAMSILLAFVVACNEGHESEAIVDGDTDEDNEVESDLDDELVEIECEYLPVGYGPACYQNVASWCEVVTGDDGCQEYLCHHEDCGDLYCNFSYESSLAWCEEHGADSDSEIESTDNTEDGDLDTEDEIKDGDYETPELMIYTPLDQDVVVTGRATHFQGFTSCTNATVTFTADEQLEFGKLENVNGDFSLFYSFSTAGDGRTISIEARGEGDCSALVQLQVDVVKGPSYKALERTDSNGKSFEVRFASFSLRDPYASFLGMGSCSKATVRYFGQANLDAGAAYAVNGGYFGDFALSYLKSRFSYESPYGNVKGPRACLAYRHEEKSARIEISMGRVYENSSWGESLFPDDSDVVCAGPQLVADGQNVFAAHYASENFEDSGISPDSPLPRSALCITDDDRILLLAAQSPDARNRGFTLPELTDYLISLACRDAMNLDGGGSTAFWVAGPPEDYEAGMDDRGVFHAAIMLVE